MRVSHPATCRIERAECSRFPPKSASEETKVGSTYHTMHLGRYCNLWGGCIVYLIALLGTWLLANERARPWAVLLLAVAAVLTVLLWRGQEWIPAFASLNRSRTPVTAIRLLYLLGLGTAL